MDKMNLYRPKLIEDKTNQELKDGILQELRQIMVGFRSLTESEHRIRKIQISKFILDERNDGIFQEVHDLEKQTKWKFTNLFEDCIAYPDKSIYPSKYYSYDIKRNSICEICESLFEDLNDQNIKICNGCLKECQNSIESKTTLDECFLFKTPEKEYWCEHANEETLLLSTDKYYINNGTIICTECIKEEENNRK